MVLPLYTNLVKHDHRLLEAAYDLGAKPWKAFFTITLPLTLLTLGLFLFVLNAFCFWLTSALVKGFEVHGFWAALFGALLVSVVSWALTAFLSDRGQVVVITRR